MNDLKYLKESYRLWLGGLTDFNSDEPLKKFKRIQRVATWTIAIPVCIFLLIYIIMTIDYDFEVENEILLLFIAVFMFIWSLTIASHIRRIKFRQKNYKTFLIVSMFCYIVGFTFMQIFKNESWNYLIVMWILFIPGFMTNANDVKTDRDELFERVEEDGN